LTSLFFSESEWENLSHYLDDPYFALLHRHNEEAVAIMAGTSETDLWTLPMDLRKPESGRNDDERWRILKHRLLRFTLSWRLTGSEISLHEARRTVDELVNPETRTVHYATAGLQHADLKTADLTFCAVFAREGLAPALAETQRQGLEAMLLDWALPEYLLGWQNGDWWRHAEFNWGASVHGCAGVAALAMREVAPDLAAEVLDKVGEGLAFVIEAMPLGGGWIEGLMYQTTTLAHLTDFIAAQHRLDGDDYALGQNRRLHDAFDFRMRMLGLDERPYNFSNINQEAMEWPCPHAFWWANHCSRPEWAGFEEAYPKPWWDTHGAFLDIEAFWLRQPHQPSTPYQHPRGLAHARELDWLTWREGETWFGMRSGWNGGNHCNLDLGQIIFGIGKERILCDPGYGAGSTGQHNCIVHRGRDQASGARSRIFRTREWKIADVRYLYVCCNLSATYPASLLYHYRHCLVAESGFLILIDDLMARDGLRVAATGSLQLRQAPILHDDLFDLAGTDCGMRGRFLTPTSRHRITQWEHGNLPVHTLTYRPDPDAPAATMALLLTCHDPAEARFELDRHTATFSHANQQFQIDLTEGSARSSQG